MNSVSQPFAEPRRLSEKMENRKYWAEEEEEDAVFGIFLKRIRHQSGLNSQCPSPDSQFGNVSYLEWQTVKVKVLKAATLERIISCLINDELILDSSYVNIFFETYREYLSTEEVVDALLAFLAQNYGTRLEQLARDLLLLLLINYPEDFMAAGRAELDESINKILQHSELHGDLVLKNALLSRMSKMNASSLPSYLEILDWIQNVTHVESEDSGDICVTAEDLLNYSDKQVAEQLTAVEATLFRRLLAHECLPQARSRSAAKKIVDTVQATIYHFNAICARVQSSLLDDVSMPQSLRLRILIKWIDIAQFLLILRNFSSLKAVISALESEPVFRLERLWSSLPQDKLIRFRELSAVFTADHKASQKPSRHKFGVGRSEHNFMTVTTTTTTDNAEASIPPKIVKNSGHRRSHSDNPGTVKGMIPYLGKYLTDLVMLDTALPDFVTHSKSSKKLLNFEKRRKQFEVLAEIRLYQTAAATYEIEPHDHFRYWFYKVLRVLHVEDCFSNSYLIEPPNNIARSISEISDNSVSSSEGRRRSGFKHGLETLKRIVSHENLLHNAPLIVARKNSISSSQSLDYRRATSTASSSENPPPKSPYLTDTFCILKVSMDVQGSASVFYDGMNLYKSILVTDNEKTPTVIRSALGKHSRDGDDPNQYDLVQVLSENEEFLIPPEATVFYAINSSEPELRFKLRRRAAPCKFLAVLPKRSSSATRSRNQKETIKKWSIRTVSVTRT